MGECLRGSLASSIDSITSICEFKVIYSIQHLSNVYSEFCNKLYGLSKHHRYSMKFQFVTQSQLQTEAWEQPHTFRINSTVDGLRVIVFSIDSQLRSAREFNSFILIMIWVQSQEFSQLELTLKHLSCPHLVSIANSPLDCGASDDPFVLSLRFDHLSVLKSVYFRLFLSLSIRCRIIWSFIIQWVDEVSLFVMSLVMITLQLWQSSSGWTLLS
jgi:hypothetical protein